LVEMFNCCKNHLEASYHERASHMPPLWLEWSHPTQVSTSQSLEIEG
jgi:hypothetical protein